MCVCVCMQKGCEFVWLCKVIVGVKCIHETEDVDGCRGSLDWSLLHLAKCVRFVHKCCLFHVHVL